MEPWQNKTSHFPFPDPITPTGCLIWDIFLREVKTNLIDVRMRNRVSPCNRFSGNFEALCPGSYYLLYTHTPGLIRTGGKMSQTITMRASFGLWIKPHNVSMHDTELIYFTQIHISLYTYIYTPSVKQDLNKTMPLFSQEFFGKGINFKYCVLHTLQTFFWIHYTDWTKY